MRESNPQSSCPCVLSDLELAALLGVTGSSPYDRSPVGTSRHLIAATSHTADWREEEGGTQFDRRGIMPKRAVTSS